jgi:hypothetical protein
MHYGRETYFTGRGIKCERNLFHTNLTQDFSRAFKRKVASLVLSSRLVTIFLSLPVPQVTPET